jgi:hypothetical protein
MAQTLENPATHSDILRLPEYMVGEVLRGGPVAYPRPAPRHTRAATALGIKIGGASDLGVGRPGGWRIPNELEIHIGDDVLVPDLAHGYDKRRQSHRFAPAVRTCRLNAELTVG